MRISPIILFSVDFIIYAIFDEDLSQDLSARSLISNVKPFTIDNNMICILHFYFFYIT